MARAAAVLAVCVAPPVQASAAPAPSAVRHRFADAGSGSAARLGALRATWGGARCASRWPTAGGAPRRACRAPCAGCSQAAPSACVTHPRCPATPVADQSCAAATAARGHRPSGPLSGCWLRCRCRPRPPRSSPRRWSTARPTRASTAAQRRPLAPRAALRTTDAIAKHSSVPHVWSEADG